MPTLTLAYSTTVAGSIALGTLKNAIANTVLPTDELLSMGISLTSDTTTSVLLTRTVIRTLVFDAVPNAGNNSQFSPSGSPSGNASFQLGSLVSSSSDDAFPNGIGARIVRVRTQWLDEFGSYQPIDQLVRMNGQTPVNLSVPQVTCNPRKLNPTVIVTDPLTVTEYGSSGVAQGQIALYSTLDARPSRDCQMVVSNGKEWLGSVVSTSDEDRVGGLGCGKVSIDYVDGSGTPHLNEDFVLTGTTPVNINGNPDHNVITAARGISFGAQGVNLACALPRFGSASGGFPPPRFASPPRIFRPL